MYQIWHDNLEKAIVSVNHEDLCIILHFIIKVIKITIKFFRT